MTVPIIGQRTLTAAQAFTEFLARAQDRNQTNVSRDNAIEALILVVRQIVRMGAKAEAEAEPDADATPEAERPTVMP